MISALRSVASRLLRSAGVTNLLSESQQNERLQTLEPRVMLAADLDVFVTSLSTRFDWLVPGDKISAEVLVENVGDERAQGQFDLVTSRVRVVGEDDFASEELGRRRYTVNLEPGARAYFTPIIIDVDATYIPGTYFIGAEAQIPDDSPTPVDDEDLSNNIGYSERTVDLVYRFGTFFGDSSRTTRRGLKLNLPMQDEFNPSLTETVTYSLSGPGFGELQFPDGDDFAIQDASILLSETTSSSSFSVAVKGGDGRTTFDEILETSGSLRSIKGPKWDLVGADILIGGTLSEFSVGDIDNAAVLIEGVGGGTKVTAGFVRDFALDSSSPISSLKAVQWTRTNEEDRESLVNATWIGSITTTANFDADIYASGEGSPRSGALGKVSIGGSADGAWSIYGAGGTISIRGDATENFIASFAGALKSLSVGQNFRGSLAAFTIGTIAVKGSLIDASILSGLDLGTDLALGGEENEQDLITSDRADGVISSITITGSVIGSFIGAGYYPGEDELSDAFFISGQGSQLRRLTIGGTLSESVLYALSFPRTVKIAGSSVDPLLEPDTFINQA